MSANASPLHSHRISVRKSASLLVPLLAMLFLTTDPITTERTLLGQGALAPELASRAMGETNETTNYLGWESAPRFAKWLANLPASQDSTLAGHELIQSLSAILVKPIDGRARYLLPRSRVLGRRGGAAWESAFPSEPIKKELQSHLSALINDIDRSIDALESRGSSWEIAYRCRWLRAGLVALQDVAPKSAWKPADAIVLPRRSAVPSKAPHPITGWPASHFQWVATPHFDIAFQGKPGNSAEIAEACEQAYAIWSQLFYPCWADKDSREIGPSPATPFQVVIFKSQESYLQALRQDVKNVSVSTGFYSPKKRCSFFYLEGKKNVATLVHELTHQFFQESMKGTVVFDEDESRGFWAVEGIALYMESFSTREVGPAMLIDVGGWDAPRIQAARYRLLHDQIWFPWAEFQHANGIRFRDKQDISIRYSQACGLAHYWMESSPENQARFTSYLRSLYLDSNPVDCTDQSDEEIVQEYTRFLQAAPLQGKTPPLSFASRSEWVLSRTAIDSEWLRLQAKMRKKWSSLDLSFTSLDDDAFSEFDARYEIGRLNLESTRISNATLKSVAKISRLEELDLSNCDVSSEGITSLVGNSNLKTLWLVGTKVDDQAIPVLRSLPKLQSVHLQGSAVTASGWQKLLQEVPRLKAGSTGP